LAEDRLAVPTADADGDGTSRNPPPAKVVPLRRQYLQIKRRFPDTILLFRLGDFYETFDDDARLAADLLDIVLTGRDMGKGVRVPMAGIPHHAAEGHIARLVAAGHKVAVCEQLGEPGAGRGLVERDVTRVITPGTLLDPAMLDARRNNFIAAVVLHDRMAGFAAADISTGEFAATELVAASADEALRALDRELRRIGPAECVVPADDASRLESLFARSADAPPALSPTESWRWRLDRAGETLRGHFGVESLDGFGCAGKPLAIRAAGGLLDYLLETHRSGLGQITHLATYAPDDFMTLDGQTRRNLELTESARGERRHSLVAILDQTRTPMGARLLRRWLSQPLVALAPLRERHDAVERFWRDSTPRAEVRRLLTPVGDIERQVNRCVAGLITPRELASLRASLAPLASLADLACDLPGASDLRASLESCEAARRLLARAIVDEPGGQVGKGDTIRAGFSSELDGHQARVREARDWIAGLERTERERRGIRSLKVGYNRVFGYYLEITAAALAAAERDRALAGSNGAGPLPADYLPKQTLANATRYITPQLKEFESIILTAQQTLDDLEADVYKRVVSEVAGQAPRLLAAAGALAYLDVVSTLADVAALRAFVRPELDDGFRIEIRDGRHPTLEAILEPGAFIANDATLDPADARITLLTGPNMAGKSSWLRQVALIVLMAQIGSFVPARSARIGLVDRIFTRIGAQDDIATGQSTFMVEMLETANILHHATRRSLVVLDEIGRGTSTYDGLAIARAIVEHLHHAPHLGCRTLFATHYHELTELEQVLPGVCCRKMDVLEDGDQVVFLHRVVPGGADRSYGVHVAQIAGIPRGIVRRAREILDDLERRDSVDGDRARKRAALRAPMAESAAAIQLTLFAPPHPAVAALKELDIESLSPLEAITKLFELRRMAQDG
jgi:DNA mismatch repair protein MutS